jgi:ABC-type multidrug transport system fused ATPase/permease subunit
MKLKVRRPFQKIEVSRTTRIFRHFGHHLKAHKKSLSFGAIALLGLVAVELARPWPLQIVFDYILLPGQATSDWQLLQGLKSWGPMAILAVASGAVIGLALIGAFLSQVQTLSLASAGLKVAAAIRLQLFSHVQQLPQSYHDYRQTGELMMRLTNDINLLKDLLVSIIMTLGSRIFVVGGMLAVMFYMNWKLTLIALAVLPLLLLASVRFSGRLRAASRRQRRKEGQLAASIYAGVDGIALSKMFGEEKQHESMLRRLVSSGVRAELRAKRIQVSYERWVDIITALGTMLVLFFGVREVLAGNLSAGSLLVFVFYLRSAYRPLQQIARLSSQITKATVCGERVMEILEMDPAIVDKADGRSARRIRGEITFTGVSFSYKSGQRALNNVSFTLPAGQTTAIIGPSGAGKSTIAKLLMRLYEPNEGIIYIDGVPVGDYRLKSLREQITPLSQELLLFRQTIRENIGFGKPEATLEEIVAAARRVGADGFIQALPEGYDTLIGEGGQTLSGGQRQRIAFARAALRDCRIMIFDEPATGLDPVAERVSQEALSALKENRTVLLITHRLNLLNLTDQVIFLENGKVVEQGTADELLVRRGQFFAFYQEWLAQTDQRGLLATPVP